MKRRVGWMVPAGLVLAVSVAWSQKRDDDEEVHFEFDAAPATPRFYAPAAMEMGATPGGAQDIAFARARIRAGEVPHPNTFTPEGLFSEHDLPLDAGSPCRQILCVRAAAVSADLLAQPEVRALAQIGFSSGLDPRTWKRDPLNLVAVVDKSGSMSGAPLDTVKASLHVLADQLGPEDQLAVVLYGAETHVHLAPTRLADRAAVHAGIDAIESAGSTDLEAGLTLGYDIATRTAPAFKGVTRVMLFTDERPNVGRTDKGSFMQMARDGSRQGVGLTTIGVGTHFGAELATAVSSVRGGNLFYFPSIADMKKKFAEDLDVMVTELAYDMKLSVRPMAGWTLAGLYGVPGDLVKRTPEGGLEMTIETIFLSREKGAIYLALARTPGTLPPAAGPLATATVEYTVRGGHRLVDGAAAHLWTDGPLPLGLARGRLLVDEASTLKKAASLHLEQNDQEGAYRLVRALRQRFEQSRVPGLDAELATLAQLDETLTRLSGHQGEPGARVATRDSVTGLPR